MSRKILEHVRDELIECRAIRSNREFCVSWLAKDESYMRGLRFHNLQPSADALATCASKLGYYAHLLSKSGNADHTAISDRFLDMKALCHQAMEQQARAKWMTPERMGL